MFRPKAIAALDAAGIDWEMAVDSDSDRTIEATVSADLAVSAVLEGTEPSHLSRIDHGGALPDLPAQKINLYGGGSGDPIAEELGDLLRKNFAGPLVAPIRAVG